MKHSKGSVIITVIIGVLALIIIGGGIWYYIENKPTACTEEAKICPNGTAVGRTGKNCEFAECPVNPMTQCKNLYWFDNVHTTCQEPEQFCGAYMRQYLQTFDTKAECETTLATKDWKTYTNTRDKVTFQYPSSYTQVATQYRSDLSGSDANSYYRNYMDSTWLPISTVKIAGYIANKFSGTYCDGAGSGPCGQKVPWTTYIFIYNNHPFQIEFNGDVSSSVENQIFSTFKFID